MTVRSSKSDNFYFFIYCHIWVKMVQYFHKLIKIIPQILKLLGIKTTKGRKLIGLSMELLWRLGYHYEAFNTQSRKKGSSLRSSPEGLRASPQQKSGPPPFWAFGPNEFKRQIQAILTFQAPVSKATQKQYTLILMLASKALHTSHVPLCRTPNIAPMCDFINNTGILAQLWVPFL